MWDLSFCFSWIRKWRQKQNYCRLVVQIRAKETYLAKLILKYLLYDNVNYVLSADGS